MLKRNLRRVTGKTEPIEKFGKLNRQKNRVSSFPSVDGISPSAIMKKLKNDCHFINIDRMEKFQITNPPKVWQPFFNFFIIADGDIPFLSTLGKPETQTLGGLVFEIFPYNQY